MCFFSFFLSHSRKTFKKNYTYGCVCRQNKNSAAVAVDNISKYIPFVLFDVDLFRCCVFICSLFHAKAHLLAFGTCNVNCCV